jgi:ABC-2 type transport system permease protein
MSRVLPVLRREYVERVRTRVFLLTTLGLPILMGALLLVPAILGARDGQRERGLMLLDRSGVLAPGLVAALEASAFHVDAVEDRPGVYEVLSDAVEAGAVGGALILDEETLRSGRAEYLVRRTPGPTTLFSLQQAVARTALQSRLQAEGTAEGLDALLRGGSLEVRRVGVTPAEGEVDTRAGTSAGFVGAFLLYMVLLLYGTAVMRSVLEEKSGRMVEIVLSALRPRDLMMGKILGVGAVGLTQLGVWLLAGMAAVRFLPDRWLGGMVGMDRGLASVLPTTGVMFQLVAFFLLGYLLYASLYAAVGAVCSREEEAQQAQLPVTLLLVVPVVLLPSVMSDPMAAFGRWMAFVPFFAPVLQFARSAAGAAAPWEIAVTLGLMALSVPVVAALAGRIYRVGLLMQGKRPGLRSLWQMIRAG